MPLRPFPSAHRIGIDICSVPRISKVLFDNSISRPLDHDGIKGAHMPFLRKLLRPEEIRALRDKFALSSLDRNHIALHVAGRWAAKEAIIKAFSPRKIGPKNIVIWQPKEPRGPKAAVLLDDGADTQDAEIDPKDFERVLNGEMVEISISHDGDYATAMALYHPPP